MPDTAVKSVKWTRRSPVLDQGDVGSCTGNADTGVLGTDSLGRTASGTVTISAAGAAASHGVFTAGTYNLDEPFALKVYTLNTILDEYPGAYPAQDTGSSSTACGKTLVALGLATSYKHSASVSVVKTALQSGPVVIGVPWYNSQFTPDADGRIPVVKSSGLAGGHEIELNGYDAENGRFWIVNSWGESWGVAGTGYFTEADLAALFADGGDVCIPTFRADSPTPTPTPTPAPADVDKTFAAALRTFITAALAWLSAKGL